MSKPIVLHFTPDVIKGWLEKFIRKAKEDKEAQANIAMLEDINTLLELGIKTLQPVPQDDKKPS